MSEIIKETLEDGSEYEFDIDLCVEEANQALSNLYDMEGEVEHFDFATAVFSLFASSIHILHDSGWSVEDLVREVYTHTDTTSQ
jgi:hypothetical protein